MVGVEVRVVEVGVRVRVDVAAKVEGEGRSGVGVMVASTTKVPHMIAHLPREEMVGCEGLMG